MLNSLWFTNFWHVPTYSLSADDQWSVPPTARQLIARKLFVLHVWRSSPTFMAVTYACSIAMNRYNGLVTWLCCACCFLLVAELSALFCNFILTVYRFSHLCLIRKLFFGTFSPSFFGSSLLSLTFYVSWEFGNNRHLTSLLCKSSNWFVFNQLASLHRCTVAPISLCSALLCCSCQLQFCYCRWPSPAFLVCVYSFNSAVLLVFLV